jgi:ATP-dependent helicase/nuclease subunit B
MTPPAQRLFTIPAGDAFLRVLARTILAGGLPRPVRLPPGPLALSRYTVLVPTRRAARVLAEAFLDESGGRALLLPRIRPIGDVDEDDLVLSGGPAIDIAPAIGNLERRLIIARDILAHRAATDAPVTPAQAVALAGELAALIDSLETEDIDLDRITGLVADDYAKHWAKTLEFLKVVTDRLPQAMAARGLIGAACRRNLLIDAEAARLAAGGASGPVIAAGSTGSIPAPARLLAAVARLDNGAVVLPGLDLDLDDEAWAALEPGHPQFGMRQLIATIGIDRRDVALLGEPGPRAARFRLLSEALRPAETTDAWAGAADRLDRDEVGDAVRRVTVIEAPSPREEALAIALILRRVLATPGWTGALVTPDRGLARRVAAELRRWKIEADDSAGLPLRHTPQGSLALLLVEAVAGDLAPVPLLALLKHPLARLGLDPEAAGAVVRDLELAALRGVRPRSGVAGLRAAVEATRRAIRAKERCHPAIRRIRDWAALDHGLDRLDRALAPLGELFALAGEADLGAIVGAHVAALEAVAAVPADEPSPLWSGEAGEALAGFFADLLADAHHGPALRAEDYPAVFRALLDGVVVRPRGRRHPRLSILGLLEARLVDADVMVLGGLNEGVWPPTATVDAWLNRPMRAELGLPPPERRIGLAAHDFVQAACADKVYLTRSQKVDGAPAVPSRWLLRLGAVLDGLGLADSVRPGADEPLLSWIRGLDDNGRPPQPVAMPRPTPALSRRPRTLSVTRIEDWIRDPYAIYARYILCLEPLDPIDADPGAAERGTAVHEAMHRFLRDYPGPLGPDALDRLLAIGRDVFDDLMDRPAVAAFWWPRFRRAAAWFVAREAGLRDGVSRQLTEISGSTEIAAPGGPFTLTARADRIDVLAGGALRICDYKTGRPPSDKQVVSGLAPQLSLEAAIAMRGGFGDLGEAEVADLVYLGLSGGDPPGEMRRLPEPAKLAAEALAGLARLVARYDDPSTGYRPRAIAEFERWSYDYDLLARHREWALWTAPEDGA